MVCYDMFQVVAFGLSGWVAVAKHVVVRGIVLQNYFRGIFIIVVIFATYIYDSTT